MTAAVRVGRLWGLALVGPTPQLLAAVAGRPATTAEIAAARVLGVRQLAEAVALQRFGARVRPWIVGVEGLHAASMVVLAAIDPQRRRLALTSLSVAVIVSALTVRDQ
jgi:hypothetical protein